jgi:lipoprotein-anchoring transpeptidase ErfK/SrfK
VAWLVVVLLAANVAIGADSRDPDGLAVFLESSSGESSDALASNEANTTGSGDAGDLLASDLAMTEKPSPQGAVPCHAVPVKSGGTPEAVLPDLKIPEKSPSGKKTMIPVNERQGKAVLYEEILGEPPGKSPGIVISLSRQRVYLLLGGELAIDSPIASGRKEGWTPKGSFTVLEKDLNHKSNRYGDLVDGEGRVVRKNVTCGATGGTFRGASMKYFLRLTWEGVGMHAGILPGYPASHGCIRLPREVAERLFKIVPTGTPVLVTD